MEQNQNENYLLIPGSLRSSDRGNVVDEDDSSDNRRQEMEYLTIGSAAVIVALLWKDVATSLLQFLCGREVPTVLDYLVYTIILTILAYLIVSYMNRKDATLNAKLKSWII